MIKILFLIGNYGVGGKERQLSYLLQYLPKDKYECHLFFKNDSGYYFDDIKEDLKSYNNLNKSNFKIGDILVLKNYINEIEPKYIFSFSNVLTIFSLIIQKLLFKNFYLIDGSIRDANNEINLKKRITNLQHNLFSYVVANSYAGLESRGQNNLKGRFVLYNGFDFNKIPTKNKEELREELGLPSDKFIVTMVSSLRNCFSKNPKRMIDIAILAKEKELSNLLFLLVGDGVLFKELQEKVIKYQLDNYIKLVGNKKDVLEYFKASDLSILFSKTEGISNSIIESMAVGTPVITTSKGGTIEIINQQNSFIIEDDIEIILKLILELKENEEFYKITSNNAKFTIESKFKIDKMIKNFEKILENILNEK